MHLRAPLYAYTQYASVTLKPLWWWYTNSIYIYLHRAIYAYMSIYILNIVHKHKHKTDNWIFLKFYFYVLQIFYGLTKKKIEKRQKVNSKKYQNVVIWL